LGMGGMLVRAGVLKLPNLLGPYLAGTGEEIFDTIGYLALSSVYATSIILLAQHEAWKPCLRPLAAVGRMALSNYLFQSFVCTTLFYSYGIGLFGKVGPAAGLCLTIAIYICQARLSLGWLRYFRFGPMEWVWRSLTYGKLQPMRLVPMVGLISAYRVGVALAARSRALWLPALPSKSCVLADTMHWGACGMDTSAWFLSRTQCH
jgi:Protein of unknown function (DUF418)